MRKRQHHVFARDLMRLRKCFGNLLDEREPHPQAINGQENQRGTVTLANRQCLGPDRLTNSLGLFTTTAEAVESNRVSRGDILASRAHVVGRGGILVDWIFEGGGGRPQPAHQQR